MRPLSLCNAEDARRMAEGNARKRNPRVEGAIAALERAVRLAIFNGKTELLLNDHWNDPDVLAPFLALGYDVVTYEGAHQDWLSWAPRPRTWWQRLFGDVGSPPFFLKF